MVDSSSGLAPLLDLDPVGDGTYRAGRSPEWDGRTYGGQLLAQGLAAARHTVPAELGAHSLHGYFLRPGDVAAPTIYRVETVRDGRSFRSRQVSASQEGRELLRMLVSYQLDEPGLDWQPARSLDGLPGPDEAPLSYTEFTYRSSGAPPGTWPGEARPMEIRYLDPPVVPAGTAGAPGAAVTGAQLMWIRALGPVPTGVRAHEPVLAYLADSTLIDHVALPHGRRWQDPRLRGASLDHAMWFHRPVPAGAWLLYEQVPETTSGGRGLATGRFYTAEGVLVATCVQEGLIRWSG